MKKAGSSSKDRLAAKSGNPKKRTPSGSGQQVNSGNPLGTGAGSGGNDEAQDAPVVIWPEWSDAEVAAEKWAVKHVFEDPEGYTWLPRSLRGLVEGYKRPVDLSPEGQSPICIQSLPLEDELFHSTAPSSTGSIGFGTIAASTPVLSRSYSKASNADTTTFNAGGNLPEALPEVAEHGEHADDDGTRGAGGDGGEEGAGGAAMTFASAGVPSGAVSGMATPTTGLALGQPPSSPHTPHTTIAEESAVDGNDGPVAPSKIDDEVSDQEALAGTSKLFQANRHLLHSDLMRTILSTLHFLYDQTKVAKASGTSAPGQPSMPDEFTPWDQIYPKAKDGLPTYNVSGKYVVKLFWLGAWRKITVDDRIPVDTEGRPLVVCSPLVQEIWPMLLTKALLKIVSLSYKDVESACEFGDFDVFHTIKGWLPEKIVVSERPVKSLWRAINGFNIKIFQATQGPPPTAAGVQPSRGGSITQPVAAGAGKDRTSAATTTTAQADRSNMPSASGARVGTGGAAAAGGGGGKSSPYVVMFAWREGEEAPEKLDLNTVSSYFRIIDTRESVMPLGNQPKDLSSIDLTNTQKLIRLRCYYTCGVRTRKPELKGASKVVEEPDTNSESTDCWMSYSEFCRAFRYVTVYHGQGGFKFVKTIHNIPDPAKAGENLRIPQVLYLPDVSQDLSVILFLSTYGRVKNESSMQVSSIIVEEYDWKASGDRRGVLRMATNAALGSYLHIPAGRQAYRFIINCPTSYGFSVWGRSEFALEDEAKYLTERMEGVHVRDFDEGFAAQQANSWFVLVKNILHFPAPVFVSASIYVPEYIQQLTCLRVFDNDTNEEMPSYCYRVRPLMFQPNKSGYTLVADCRTLLARPGGKWKLRVISEPTPVFSPEKPLDMWTKPTVQDFDDIFTPNKHNILFRYVVKVKDAPINCASLQLTFSFPSVWLRIQIFDNGQEVRSTRGKGVATLHAINLLQTEDPVVPVVSSSTKPERGGEKADKKSSKEAAKEPRESSAVKDVTSLASPAVDVAPLPKHKYIIQGSVENIDLAKLVGLLPPQPVAIGSESNRPASRGVKAAPPASASAKKKRSATVSGGTAPGISVSNTAYATATEERPAPTGNEPSWKLRIVSTDTASLVVARDTEKEDRYRAFKDAWETAQPGRAARGRESRELYLRQVESGVIRPIVITGIGGKDVPYKPWTIHGTMAAARLARQLESTRDSHSSILRPEGEGENGGGGLANNSSSVQSIATSLPPGSPQSARNPPPSGGHTASPLSHQPISASQTMSHGHPSSNQLSSSRPSSSGASTTRKSSAAPSRAVSATSSRVTSKPRVLSGEERAAIKAERQEALQEHEKYQEALNKARAEDKERRAQERQLYIDKLDEKVKLVDTYRELDMGRREAYRQKVIKEIEEAQAKVRAAIEAAARDSALAAEMGAEAEAAAALTAEKDKLKKRVAAKR